MIIRGRMIPPYHTHDRMIIRMIIRNIHENFRSGQLVLGRQRTLGTSYTGANNQGNRGSRLAYVGSHYASGLPLFANANHVLAMGAKVIGRVHTVSIWVLLNVALDASCSCFESLLLLRKRHVVRDAQVSPMDWREVS